MLNGLLMKSKFCLKCKPAIKLTKTRIEIISKKRNSMQKYLMGDIADLLKNRLDSKAYDRVEGLYAETNLSDCYTFVAKSCDFVYDNLSLMDKQRDCPEECKEAVSSLIFAAARFADLPELRDLRAAFIGRYENSLDANCSKEFVEKLKAKTPTEDMKLKILKDIALEYSVEWKSKPLERKLLVNPLPSQQDRMKNIMDADKRNDIDETILARRRKKEIVDPVEKKRETKDTKLVERRVNYADESKPILKPPPGHQKVENLRKANPAIELPKPLKLPPGHQNVIDMRKASPAIELPKPLKPPTGHQKVVDMRKANPAIKLPKPLKLPPGRQKPRGVVVEGETSLRKDEEEKISRKKKSKEKEEEDRMMDSLLMHYSSKQSPYQQREVEASLKHHHPIVGVDMGGGRESRRRSNKESKPSRSSSLPPDQMNSERERIKSSGHGRNGSLNQEMLSLSPTRNVHPNLPDYDDFVARFAAFKGN